MSPFPGGPDEFGSVGVGGRYAGRRDAAGEAATIDDDEFTVDMIGSVGGEEHGERTDILVFTDPADGNEFAALEEFHQRRIVRKDAGHDAVGLNIVVRVGERERARQLEDRTLRAGIHVVMFSATQAITRGDIDDLAALALDHVGKRGTRAVELARQIGVDTGAPVLVGDFLDPFAEGLLTDPGVVDQDVDLAKLRDRRVDHRVDLRGAGDVGRLDQTAPPELADRGRGLFELGEGARGGHDVGAAVGEANRHRAAESAPRTGDDRDFSFEAEAFQYHAWSPSSGWTARSPDHRGRPLLINTAGG